MKSAFSMIVHKFPYDYSHINIYTLADVHIGSRDFNKPLFDRWIKTVESDPLGYVLIAGDLVNNNLKGSKGNCYEDTMQPEQQMEYAIQQLSKIANRILGWCIGNHEYRSMIESGIDIAYNMACRVGVVDVYRQDACFIKVNLGKKYNNKQCSYSIAMSHGGSKNKTNQWVGSLDGGIDIVVTGHTHDGTITPRGKVRVDTKNEIVTVMDYTHIVCTSFQSYGGYSLRGMYLPTGNTRFQSLILDGSKKAVSVLLK